MKSIKEVLDEYKWLDFNEAFTANELEHIYYVMAEYGRQLQPESPVEAAEGDKYFGGLDETILSKPMPTQEEWDIIQAEAESRYAEFCSSAYTHTQPINAIISLRREAFKSGATFGMGLKEKETERLKELLYKVVTMTHSECHPEYKKEVWNQFCKQNNIEP